eukprot:s617_g31.t1
MGYPTGYTLALFKKEPATPEEKDLQETERAAAIGNSFHAVVVACLVDLWLWAKRIRTDPLGATEIVRRWHEELQTKSYNEFGGLLSTDGPGGQLSQKELEEEEAVVTQPVAPKNAEWLKLCGHPKAGEITADPLSVRLILQYLRRMEYRGSDIRLDLGVIFKGDTVRRTTIDPRRWLWKTGQSYRCGHKEHINLLELRAVLRSLEWRARKSNFHSCRFMHLSDSQIVLAVLTKGRSSSRRVNGLLRKASCQGSFLIERQRQKGEGKGRRSESSATKKVSPGTKERYATTLRSVASSLNLSAQALLSRPDLEDILCSYIEKLWEDGETRTFGSYALAAVQFYAPTSRGKLREAWKLMGLWQKLEQPRRATPMDPAMLFAFAGTFWNWRWEDLACLTVVGFAGLLRTGEMFGLKRSDVVLSRQSRQASILFLYHTKTAQRKMINSEKVLIYEQCAQACLRRLCKGKSADDFLVDISPAKYRSLWKDIVSHLKLEKFHYLPYSLRRGGATSAHREGMSYDQLLTKGRWQSLSTAQLYVDQATQELAALQLPMDSISRIRAAQRCFKAAGLGRVEGDTGTLCELLLPHIRHAVETSEMEGTRLIEIIEAVAAAADEVSGKQTDDLRQLHRTLRKLPLAALVGQIVMRCGDSQTATLLEDEIEVLRATLP